MQFLRYVYIFFVLSFSSKCAYGDHRRKTKFPTKFPTRYPSKFPTRFPTRYPSNFPTRKDVHVFQQKDRLISQQHQLNLLLSLPRDGMISV